MLYVGRVSFWKEVKMKLHTIKIIAKREDLKSKNAPFEIQETDESIEMPEEKLLMSILDRILRGDVINATEKRKNT